MTSVLLVYPYFRGSRDRSRFRFPPLGPAYVAASLRAAGHEVRLLDCTFLRRDEALHEALAAKADVVGLYCMETMLDDCLALALRLRPHCGLLVAGGPLPTCDPGAFLARGERRGDRRGAALTTRQDAAQTAGRGSFDAVVCGEGEQTMVELVRAYADGDDLGAVPGVVCRAPEGAAGAAAPDAAVPGAPAPAAPRAFAADLDAVPFPARDLLPNADYIRFGRRKYGAAVTTVMSTRGCPFACEFCSNVVFGASYRERSPENVLDEVEEALALGYDRISFADDVFTMSTARVLAICTAIERRRLRFTWECLARVDTLDEPLARAMKRAGCTRVFFGIESGNDATLRLMNKKTTTAQARSAVAAARRAGLGVGAFFILFYPGETAAAALDTLRLATELPLDYLGLTLPYPLPGTALHARMGERVRRAWRPGESPLLNQVVTYDAGFSTTKMRFGILKGQAQFKMKRRLGRFAAPALKLFERPTDAVLRLLP